MMVSWHDFLQIVADEQGLVKEKERQAFLTRFAQENLEKEASDTQISRKLGISIATLRRRLTAVYTAFETRCEKLAETESKGKSDILLSHLKQEYRQYQKQEKPLSQTQTPVSSIPTINWHQICESRLNAYKQRFLNNPLTAGNPLDFYVPLGLIEPKREQQKRQKDEVNPEEGSRFYQLPETEITTTYTEPNQFFEEVLRQGNSKTKGQRLAIIGEPGAGKTTLLYQISRWILQENLGYPILIRLAEVNQPLRQFLTQNWLRDATGSLTDVSPEWVSEFEKLITGGKVWLLLDAVDEMGITSPLATINQQLTEGWMQGLRVLLTCRLNVWETEKNALRDFDVYRNLDFNSQQIQEFIEQYFRDATQSQELLKQLKEPNQNRVNDLIKNPLRLGLLCRTWKRGQKLPETQAGLYQRLVESHYQLKDEQQKFKIPELLQENLNQQLGELAKDAINREQFRFRLEEKFVEQFLGKPQQENTLFSWALNLGWLNRVGLVSLEEKDSDQAVYAFFHPTFQEYFAALAIQDWDYFLPRNHVNCPVEGKEYRIFQPQWKQVILLWLGRDDVDEGEKEEFIEKLLDFDEGFGDSEFYLSRAYFLAAAGINEFKECSLSDEIVEAIIKFGFGYFDIKEQTWVKFIDPIAEGAKKVLPETIRKSAIDNLIQVLETTENEYTHGNVADSLREIDPGNHLAIQALIQVLQTTDDLYTSLIVTKSLRKIDPGNQLAIQALIQALQTTEDEDIRSNVAYFLGELDPGNELAIQALIRVLETTNNEYTRMDVCHRLATIPVGNDLAILALIRVLETTNYEYTRWIVAYSFSSWTIAVGNDLAIRELIQVLERTEKENTRWSVAYCLGKIDLGNEFAIRGLIRILETTDNEDTRWRVAQHFAEINPDNELVIRELIRVVKMNANENTRSLAADSLEKIDPDKELLIRELIRVLEMTHDEDTRSSISKLLESFYPNNQLVIRELIRVLETTNDEATSISISYFLSKIIEHNNELIIMDLIQTLKRTKNEYNRRSIADILGEIAVGNELVIMALMQVLKTTENEYNRSSIAYYLWKIDPGNKLAIQELILLLETTNDKHTRGFIDDSLQEIINTGKKYEDVVFPLKHNLTNEVYKNNFDLFEKCFKLLWQCADNLTYPKFYQAWHHKTLTPHPEIIDNTPVGNTPTVRQLEQQFTDICSKLPYPHLHCIDAKKLQNLNTESKFVQAFCNRLYQKLLPNETIPTVQTVIDLETKIINLKKQLQTPHLFILLQGDATPSPEVIECCDYLTDVLNLAWVTPEALPGSSSQRFFLSSQENLLDAVRSWVEENQISRG